MEQLHNNENLQWLSEEWKEDNNTQNELNEVLSWKTFDKEKFYEYLCKRIELNSIRLRRIRQDSENHAIHQYLDKLEHEVWKIKLQEEQRQREEAPAESSDEICRRPRRMLKKNSENNSEVEISKTLSEEEVKKILSDLNDYLCKNSMEPLKAVFDQEIPSFRANQNDKDYYLEKIKDRSLSVEEYEKMQRQIEEHGSILARSSKRPRNFGSWYWDVILSYTTWKFYDVEWDWEAALGEDYKSRRYYTSRSWASAAWNIIAWKWSLIYMPTSRVDVTYPKLCFRDINWLNMTMCTDRWVINESMPTVIKSWKVNLWVDAVLLSQKNHLEQWTARVLINTIETKGDNLRDWPVYTYKIKYYDENLELKEKAYTYKTNMDPKELNLGWRWKEIFWIDRGFEVDQTWSFIDKVVWIRKYKWKYVRLWKFGLIKEVFDEHPSSDMNKQYYEGVEIGDKNEIIHTKYEVKPMFSEKDTTKKFNGWIMTDNFAYKNIKQHYLGSWEMERICSEHKMEYDEAMENDDVYHLVYEDDISAYNELLKKVWQTNVNMEFEYYVPKTIFEKYSVEYWKKFLSEKLKEKALKTIDVHSFPSEVQKSIALNYLKSHKDTIFTLQDSYDSWNCHPWTERFVKSFNLPEKISGKELLEHKDIEKMLAIFDFRKIFVRKVVWDF